MLSITDTSCGMDTETKAKIFGPFFPTKGEQGNGFTDDRNKHMESHTPHHNLLYKPYTSHALLPRIRQLLDEDNLQAGRMV